MKKLIVVLSLMMPLVLSAQVYDGLTCETAIPVDTAYEGSIPSAGVYHYSAWTYDLPLACYFYPSTEEVSELYLDVDFTCTPGVYDDPKIVDLLNTSMGWGIEMPIRFKDFEKGVDDNGRTYYTISIQETYRELMANFGVTYDVQALIKVTTSSAGDVRMAPDTTFKACVENSTWLNLPDTAYTSLMNNDASYVLPMADWANDSIRYRWTGTQAPVQVWIGDKCDFNLSTTGENCAVDYFQLEPDAGNGENVYEMSRQMIWDMIDFLEKGGIYYVRIISTEDAELIIEKQPVDGPLANAVALELDESTQVSANAIEQVYYFPSEWKNRNLEFVSSVATPITAYVSQTIDFEASVTDANVIGVYEFVASAKTSRWQMSQKEMNNLCEDITGEFVFVKFVAEQSTSITPLRWMVCDCVQKTAEIYPTDVVEIKAKTSSLAYRINYKLWSKRDVKLYWSSVADMNVYLTDTCAGFSLQPTNEHVLLFNEYLVDNQGVTDTLTITSEYMKTLADYVDEDGYLYFRFDAKSYGDLIVSSVLVDSTIDPLDPCDLVEQFTVPSILALNETDADFVYAMSTANLSKDSVRLTWRGNQNLTIFVGTTCTFSTEESLTSYTLVPNNPLHFSKDLLEMVSVDGKVYLRFVANESAELNVGYVEPEPIKAIPLALNSTINIPADNIAQTYCFTRDWENISVEFTTNTADSVIAYMGTKADFELFEPKTGYIAQYPFFMQNNQSRLQLSAKQLSTLLDGNAADTIYVVFFAFDDVQITPILWNACACVESSFELMPNDQKLLAANSESTIYRVNYSQWQDHKVRLHWGGDAVLWAYLGDICNFNLSATDRHVLNQHDTDILPNDTMVIGEEVRALAIDWGFLPADGFLYFHFLSTSSGVLTTSIINEGGGTATDVENVWSGNTRPQLFCTPEGMIYILVEGERYTILGEKL